MTIRGRKITGRMVRGALILNAIALWTLCTIVSAFAGETTTVSLQPVYSAQDLALLVLVSGLVLEHIVRAIRGAK